VCLPAEFRRLNRHIASRTVCVVLSSSSRNSTLYRHASRRLRAIPRERERESRGQLDTSKLQDRCEGSTGTTSRRAVHCRSVAADRSVRTADGPNKSRGQVTDYFLPQHTSPDPLADIAYRTTGPIASTAIQYTYQSSPIRPHPDPVPVRLARRPPKEVPTGQEISSTLLDLNLSIIAEYTRSSMSQ
jgi:hypothetical protein